MTVFFEDDRKKSWGWGAPLLFLVAILILSNFPEWELRYKTSKVVTRPLAPVVHVEGKMVTRGSENEFLHSRLFQLPFSQDAYISGQSPDELSIRFDVPVDIRGILVSVDCWKSTRLVEFAAGINQKPAYSTNSESDMLMHTSFATNSEAGKIDEQAFFPTPFRLSPDDRINIGAWIQNISGKKQIVSPKIIVYYNWVGAPLMAPRTR